MHEDGFDADYECIHCTGRVPLAEETIVEQEGMVVRAERLQTCNAYLCEACRVFGSSRSFHRHRAAINRHTGERYDW